MAEHFHPRIASPGPAQRATETSGVATPVLGRLDLATKQWDRFTSTSVVLITIVVVILAAHMRWSLASTLSWQCDELPLIQRFTGLCGYVTNETEAAQFKPSLFTFRHGALRSVRAPRFPVSIHTTTGFWANLTLHVFGVTPLAGRAAPLFWSILAIFTAAWATMLVTRSIVASCIAAWIVALSPHAVAYGAQLRGYAEAMALTPLLLITIEVLRRRPDRWIRAVVVFVCALQLALTVYTAWVYWVLPTLVVALLAGARSREKSAQRATRLPLTLIALGLVSAMAIYSVDRWGSLVMVASRMGVPLDQPGAARTFGERVVTHLYPDPTWLMLFAFVGVVVVWRSPARWWLGAMLGGVAAPLALAIVSRSAGYERNFGYLIGPSAVLCGAGVAASLRAARQWLPQAGVALATIAGAVGMSAWAYAGLGQRAHEIILPDWGDVVTAVDGEPETVGPRWFCRCFANYWQINWYRGIRDYSRVLDVAPGESIEVVLGAQLDHEDRPTVYRVRPDHAGYIAHPLPEYLKAVDPTGVRSGVELRRWRAVRFTEPSDAMVNPDSPVFVVVNTPSPFSAAQWRRVLESSDAHEMGVVTFKYVTVPAGSLESMILPARAWKGLRAALHQELRVDDESLHAFSLSPLPRVGVGADAGR